MPEMIEVGDLTFEVRRSSKRKSISIVVDRGGQLVISAPVGCPSDTLLSTIESKKQWIYSKLLNKEALVEKTPPLKEYVSGEGFPYLGKSYRLRIVDPDLSEAYTPPLRFFRGYFLLSKSERHKGREHFINWYTVRCRSWLEPRIHIYAQRIGVDAPSPHIMDLGYRWGSCSPDRLNFHWRAVMLPPNIIEYVIVHELVHLIEPNHSRAFWQYVERVILDWQERKTWLADNGILYFI